MPGTIVSTTSKPGSPGKQQEGRILKLAGSGRKGTHLLTWSNSGAPVAQAQLGKAGQAWLERNGTGRSRPVDRHLGLTCCRGPLLNSLSDQYMYMHLYIYTGHWRNPTKDTEYIVEAGGRGLCIATSAAVSRACADWDADTNINTSPGCGGPRHLGRHDRATGKQPSTTTLKVIWYEAGTHAGQGQINCGFQDPPFALLPSQSCVSLTLTHTPKLPCSRSLRTTQCWGRILLPMLQSLVGGKCGPAWAWLQVCGPARRRSRSPRSTTPNKAPSHPVLPCLSSAPS